MDVLTKKSKRYYDYTSRYAVLPYYYHTIDKKYIYGIARNITTKTDYVLHVVSDTDTLDSLALKYYGRPDLFWVIGQYNHINDPYKKLIDRFNYIYIPTLSAIRYE